MKFCILGCILSLYIGLEHFFRESVQNTNETMIGQQYVSSAFPDIGMTSFLFMKADHRSGLLKNAFILTGMTSSFFSVSVLSCSSHPLILFIYTFPENGKNFSYIFWFWV